jgi:hypothetical protein
MNRVRLLILAGVTAGALAPAVAAVAPAMAAADPGSIGIRLAEAPANRVDDPRAKIYIVDHLAPGTTIHRRVEVSNDTDTTRRIQLYAAGAEITGGAFTFRDGHESNELSGWTTVDPPQINLAARTKGSVSVTVRVPAEASAGERYAVVWAEAAASQTAGSVRVVNRVGVRAYVSVGPGGEPVSSFVITSLTTRRQEDGVPVVEAQVQNTGGRAVQLSGHLELTDGPGGLSAGPFPVESGTAMAPGQSAVVTMLLDRSMPLGPWEAKLVLQSGTVESPATARITFPAEAGTSARPVATKTGSAGQRTGLVVAVALLLLVLVTFILLLLWKRRRDEEEEEDGPAGAAPKPVLAASPRRR